MAAFFVGPARLGRAGHRPQIPARLENILIMALKDMALVAALALAAAGIASPAGAAGTSADEDGQYRWLHIVNRSSVPIHYFYMTDVHTRSWGNDLLGRRTVEPGEAVRVFPNRVQSARGYCRFDLRIGFAGGQRTEVRAFNLCRAQAVVCTSPRRCGVR